MAGAAGVIAARKNTSHLQEVGQIHGSAGPALYEEIPYDDDGNNRARSLMDLVPTAVETPTLDIGHTVTPSPHHPLGTSATVGVPPGIANAVVDGRMAMVPSVGEGGQGLGFGNRGATKKTRRKQE